MATLAELRGDLAGEAPVEVNGMPHMAGEPLSCVACRRPLRDEDQVDVREVRNGRTRRVSVTHASCRT
jgi:hypothetical protein